MSVLYKLNFSSGKSYIGITKFTAEKRFQQHKRAAKKKGNIHLYNAWNKHGEPFLQILAHIEESDIYDAEIRAIKAFNTLYPNGYNSTSGGDVSPGLNPEIAAKISKTHTGMKRSPEARAAMSRAQLGTKSCVGRVLSEETRRKIGEANKGNQKRLGKFHTEEIKRKISETKARNKLLKMTYDSLL